VRQPGVIDQEFLNLHNQTFTPSSEGKMLYKYVGARTESETLQILESFCERHVLKVSEPASFNDPFEFKVALDFDADEGTMRKRFFEDNPEASHSDYEYWCRHHTKQKKWWVAQETRRELLGRFGVFCMSAVDDNYLMWSHYSQKHTGFCVGIDESHLCGLKGLIGQGFVKYQKQAPKFRFYFESPELFQNSISMFKSDDWSYEKEYRYLFDSVGLLEFPPVALKEVILGCRSYMPLRRYAHEHCEENGSVRFFQMCEDFGEYSLLKQPLQKNSWQMSSFF
jgi:DUF2971 family protein